MVDRRGEEAVLTVEACLVVAITPWSDVTRAEMLKPLYTGDPAPLLELRDVLLEDPLTTPSENDLGLLGVADRRISFDFLTEMLLSLRQVGFPLGDVWRIQAGRRAGCVLPLRSSARWPASSRSGSR